LLAGEDQQQTNQPNNLLVVKPNLKLILNERIAFYEQARTLTKGLFYSKLSSNLL